MKVVARELAHSLDRTTGVIAKRVTAPVLACALMEPAEGGLSVTAHSLEACATATCAGQVDGFAPCAVPAAALQTLVERIPPDTLVTLKNEDATLKVSAGKSRYLLPTTPAAEFPSRLRIADGTTIKLDQRLTRRHFSLPAFAASTEETRYYLNGVSLRPSNGLLVSAATDGITLAETTSPLPDNADPSWSDIIIPNDTIKQIVRLTGKHDEIIVKLSKRLIEAQIGNVTITSKLIDGRFPDYQRVIPPPSPNQCTVDRKQLLAGLERLNAMTLAEKLENRASVSAAGLMWPASADGGLAINLWRRDCADDLISTISHTGSAKVALSVTRLVELLENVPGDRVVLDSPDRAGTTPVRITCPDDAHLLFILVPMTW